MKMTVLEPNSPLLVGSVWWLILVRCVTPRDERETDNNDRRISLTVAVMAPSIAVVGGGVVGLTTAVTVQQQVPGSEVRVISDQWSPNITRTDHQSLECTEMSSFSNC